MSIISCTIFPDAEAWLRENLPDMCSDNVCSIHPSEAINLNGLTPFIDYEDDSVKGIGMDDFVRALQKLCNMVGTTLFVGGIKGPMDLVDPCNWDAEVVDAFWQLAFYNEVIYG